MKNISSQNFAPFSSDRDMIRFSTKYFLRSKTMQKTTTTTNMSGQRIGLKFRRVQKMIGSLQNHEFTKTYKIPKSQRPTPLKISQNKKTVVNLMNAACYKQKYSRIMFCTRQIFKKFKDMNSYLQKT